MEITQYTLPGESVFPEGIAADPDGVRFYVSSAREGTIFRGRTDRAEAEVWQPAGPMGELERSAWLSTTMAGSSCAGGVRGRSSCTTPRRARWSRSAACRPTRPG